MTTGRTGRATGQRWERWVASEPVLGGLDDYSLRAVLADRDMGQQRRDELLAALVRLAQNGDSDAGGVLIDCLGPGIRARARRYRGRLDWDDAYAEVVAGLWEQIQAYDSEARPCFVASRLLAAAGERLRRRARSEQLHVAHTVPLQCADVASEPGPELSAGLLLDTAVTAGTVTTSEAALIAAADVDDLPLAMAARRAGCGYEAAKKSRQRALPRLAAWLTDDSPAVVLLEAA